MSKEKAGREVRAERAKTNQAQARLLPKLHRHDPAAARQEAIRLMAANPRVAVVVLTQEIDRLQALCDNLADRVELLMSHDHRTTSGQPSVELQRAVETRRYFDVRPHWVDQAHCEAVQG